MFEYFHDMLKFLGNLQKHGIKQVTKIRGFASGKCNYQSRNSKLATNDFIRLSKIIKNVFC